MKHNPSTYQAKLIMRSWQKCLGLKVGKFTPPRNNNLIFSYLELTNSTLNQEKNVVSTLPMAVDLFPQFPEPRYLKELHRLVVGASVMSPEECLKYLQMPEN